MTEQDTVSTFINYERVSKIANDLYKKAEGLVGIEGSNTQFRELMGSCAFLEEQAFLMSMGAGVGSLIRDTHARYVVQNFYRAGLYNDVIRFGRKAKEHIVDADSKFTVRQIDVYVEAATINVLGCPKP
ncbi:MAG: hypothetical protein ACD_24C00436G0002 [uncultured bacterium]|nr:MAG: hypothetical protein ACD_24C00436G0002 [uncultured bacterium]